MIIAFAITWNDHRKLWRLKKNKQYSIQMRKTGPRSANILPFRTTWSVRECVYLCMPGLWLISKFQAVNASHQRRVTVPVGYIHEIPRPYTTYNRSHVGSNPAPLPNCRYYYFLGASRYASYTSFIYLPHRAEADACVSMLISRVVQANAVYTLLMMS